MREEKLPVHQDDEYRIRLEKEELLKMLGVGMDPEEFRQLTIHQAVESDSPARQTRLTSTRADRPREGIGATELALLRIIVLQNELVLHAFKRLEEIMSARPKVFNPADWK